MAEDNKDSIARDIVLDEQPRMNLRMLELLSRTFPNVASAATEIINLEAILNLPKGTEHFVADLHGEDGAFRHILRNASGNIRRKVTELYSDALTEEEIRQLCSLIYYPEQKLELMAADDTDLSEFYLRTLPLLVGVLRTVSSKYTRSKVRKALPARFAYIIEELLNESPTDYDKAAYFRGIQQTIVSTGRAEDFIIALCNVIQRLSIDQLHVLGDVFDRGPGAHLIMDTLCDYGRFDIQWGNHDVLWMGACAGNDSCIANVLRLSLRYGNMTTLEDGYGINLLPLATLALDVYGQSDCSVFMPKLDPSDRRTEKDRLLLARMHKAISIIQFKLEASIIRRHPEWKMEDRLLLNGLSSDGRRITIDGKEYELRDADLPTVDPADPYRLTDAENEVVRQLHHSFRVSEKLSRHIRCLFNHGSMFQVCNSNLLFHASIPLNPDGTLREVEVAGRRVKGRDLMKRIGMVLRDAFNDDTSTTHRRYARDHYWYLWCGPDSPLFDKSKMATFERYFIDDPALHKEEKGNYFRLRDDARIINHILDEFGVTGEHRHIINGHVPVRLNRGETPIRAGGSLMVIDGGFSRPYHETTGAAGYTLVYHSRGFQLVRHEPFTSVTDAVRHGTDIVSRTEVVERSGHRMRVRDTDKGAELSAQIEELRALLHAYRHGLIKQS